MVRTMAVMTIIGSLGHNRHGVWYVTVSSLSPILPATTCIYFRHHDRHFISFFNHEGLRPGGKPEGGEAVKGRPSARERKAAANGHGGRRLSEELVVWTRVTSARRKGISAGRRRGGRTGDRTRHRGLTEPWPSADPRVATVTVGTRRRLNPWSRRFRSGVGASWRGMTWCGTTAARLYGRGRCDAGAADFRFQPDRNGTHLPGQAYGNRPLWVPPGT